jgi:hypothetical protein
VSGSGDVDTATPGHRDGAATGGEIRPVKKARTRKRQAKNDQ